MANTENINVVMNEEVIDAVAEAAEAIPVKAENKFGVIGAVVVVGGIAIAGIAMGIRYIKNKKKLKEAQQKAADTGVDNVKVVKDDFEEYDSAEG